MLNDEQVKEFQKYLINNHAGAWRPRADRTRRAALVGRVNVHAHGNSVADLRSLNMVEMRNKGVTPCLSERVVGASGDLLRWHKPRS